MPKYVLSLLIVVLAVTAGAEAQTNPCGGSTPYATLTFGSPPNQTQQTLCGAVENVNCASGNQARQFLGIPYGTAGRWQMPVLWAPAGSAPPPIQATKYGAICPQDMGGKCTAMAQCGSFFQNLEVSENCQFLNVWTPPNAGPGDNYPVMVWIHGGAFYEGASSVTDPNCRGNIYDGGYLASENNIVVVSLNYRLGALGYLASEDKNAGGDYLAGGNFGIMDQQIAIQWVIDHIAGFGGDPTKIVLAGESAGAISVGMHLTGVTDLTNITGGIMESNPLGIPMKKRSDAQTYYFKNFVKYFYPGGNPDWSCPLSTATCSSGDSTSACFAKIQSQALTSDVVTAQDCAVAQLGKWITEGLNGASFLGKALELALPWAPIVDGTVYDLANWNGSGPIPTQPFPGQPITRAGSINKPILLGTNANEGLLFIDLGSAPISCQAQLQDTVEGIFGGGILGPSPVASQVLAHYPATDSGTNFTDPAIQALGDYGFTCANQYFANQARAANGNNVWAYQFNEVSAFLPAQGAALECCSSQNCPTTPSAPSKTCPNNPTPGYCTLGGATCGTSNSYCCLGSTCHGAELPYVFADTALFENGTTSSKWTPNEMIMADDIANYWGNFVKNPAAGPAPSGSNLVSWPNFAGNNYLLMSTAQSGFFTVGDVVTSMQDAPVIDCSLFQPCYGNASFPSCSSSQQPSQRGKKRR